MMETNGNYCFAYISSGLIGLRNTEALWISGVCLLVLSLSLVFLLLQLSITCGGKSTHFGFLKCGLSQTSELEVAVPRAVRNSHKM